MAFMCKCGLRAVIKTSWMATNPGRRFWGCPMYMANGMRGCNFLQWLDPEPCSRCMNCIPGLLRTINGLEKENEKKAKKERKLIIAVVVCVIWIIYLLGYNGSEDKNGGGMQLYELE